MKFLTSDGDSLAILNESVELLFSMHTTQRTSHMKG